MIGLARAVQNYDDAVVLGDTAMLEYKSDIVRAARHHMVDSHISISYADGSVSRKEVVWNAEEQRFIDWGNNYWLYGPKSTLGKGSWVLVARHESNVVVQALMQRAKFASQYGRVAELWNLYWQIMLSDATEYSRGEMVDLHIKPLDVDALEIRSHGCYYQTLPFVDVIDGEESLDPSEPERPSGWKDYLRRAYDQYTRLVWRIKRPDGHKKEKGVIDMTSRIYGLDAWRAGLLLAGPVIHSAGLVLATGHPSQLLANFVFASNLFRMEAFFAISGFLMARLQLRSNGEGFLRRRIIQLAVPTYVVWFGILPLTSGADRDVFDPLHLWFLIALIIITPLGFIADYTRISQVLHRVIQRHTHLFGIVFVVLALGMAEAARGAIYVLHADKTLTTTLLLTPYYAVFYMTGFLVSRQDALCQWMATTRLWWVGLVAWGLAMAWFNWNFNIVALPSSSILFKLTRTALMADTAVLMTFTVLATAVRVRQVDSLVKQLSAASYTIYLLHVPVIALLYKMVHGFADGLYLFAILAVGTFGITWIIHECVIKPVSLFRFLLNGRF